jgi:ABC-type transporter Mla subunit MlaD
MRRIALIIGSLASAAAIVVTAAGASDSRTYQAELFNAFGLVKGSELRVAGVKAGTITGLDVSAQKTALISFTVDPGFPEFKSDASCASEPQSLIAEYYLNCQPGTSPQPLDGPIPAAANKTTVQPDLAQNTLREPFKRRLQLIINEFGTALVGNSENLNAAIRSGAPALQQLKQVLNILGRQNTTIAELNANSDAIFQQLTDRREDLVRFIDNAGRTAAISAERANDLSQNFNLLDDFLVELQPVVQNLGNLAEQQTPLLIDLHKAAPGLNKLATNLPAFNEGTRQSLLSLGGAASIGKVAVQNAKEEISALNQSSTKAYPAADIVAKFLESISDPRNAVEEDSCARFDLRGQPGEADRRVQLLNQKLNTTLQGDQTAPCPWPGGDNPGSDPNGGNPGYTGMEGLLNYAYIQTNSLNLYDQIGHSLHFTYVNAPGSDACTTYQSGVDGGVAALRSMDNGGDPTDPSLTFDPKNYRECAGILGDKQPNINYGQHNQCPATSDAGACSASPSYNPGDPGFGLFGNLHAYDDSVCPTGSFQKSICDPAVSFHGAGFQSATAAPAAPAPAPTQEQIDALPEAQKKRIQDILGGKDPSKLKDEALKKLQDQLGLPPLTQIPGQLPQIPGINATPTAPTSTATDDLLGFLFGP